jgi:ligand-binding sensor domain-containing protein
MRLTYLCSVILTFSLIFTSCKDSADDGNERGPVWVSFTAATTPGLMSNYIYCIMKDGEGSVWFGTDSGASKYSSGRWTTLRDSLSWVIYTQPRSTAYKVYSMAEGRGGIIWFGLGGGGLRAYNRNKTSGAFKSWQRFGFSGNVIDAVGALKNINGDVWASVNNNGVYRYVPPTVDIEDPLSGYFVQESADKFQSNVVRCIATNPFNEWVFFGAPAGVAYVNTRTSPWSWSFHELQPGYSSPVSSIAVDFSNTIWAGKWFGVTEYNPGTAIENNFIPGNTGNILPDAYINAAATNLYDIRWFGTSVGLVQYTDTTWTIFKQSDTPALPSNNILSLYYDPIRKNLWIGTDKGITVYNKEGTNLN